MLGIKTATPMGDWRTFPTIAKSGGVVKDCMDKIHDTVGFYVQSADAGDAVAFAYHVEKVTVPKLAASAGLGAFAGDKVFYSAANAAVTPVADANLWIGIFVKDCLSADTEALIDLKGDKAHS